MTEAAKPKSTSSSSSGTLPGSEPAPIVGDKSSFAQTHPNLQRTISRDVPVNYFSPDGDLQRTLSRQQSGWSTHTQDPNADDFDYEKHVRHLLRRAEESGIKQRDLGVTFKDLTVTGEGSGILYGASLTGLVRAIPALPKTIAAMRHPKVKTILDGFTGTLRPGEMTLVLGRPGSGCTSFLKTIANYTESFRGVEGTISYDGATPQEMRKHHAGDLAYLPEDDHHLPHLTVGETLSFAAAARTPAAPARLGSRNETIERKRDVLLTLFGLKHTYNTKVGNDVVRGVSGGERKRVSIAELLTTGCKLGCHDNSSRGLDASSALEYVSALKVATKIGRLTSVLSLYQAGEQLYTLFDRVAVLYEGQLIYFGPAHMAVGYFKEMGYEPQPRQTSADFLVAVTDVKGRFPREGYESKVPKTPLEFVDYWKKSSLYKQLVEEVDAQLAVTESEEGRRHLESYRQSAAAERVKRQSKKSPYLISYPMMLRLAMKRRYRMQMNDLPTLAIVSIAALFQALIIGSVYFQMPKDTSGFFSRGGVTFFSILYNTFTGMAEITSSYSQRPVVVRQRNFAQLRPSADAFAQTLVDVPFKFVTVVVFDIVLYFMAGLGYSADQFFIFLLFTFITTMAMLIFFRMLASINRAEPNATLMAGLAVLVIAIYVGYAIPRPSMRVWFRWLSYAQPVSFGFEVLLTNEFRKLNVPCATLVPAGPSYPAIAVANQACAGTQGSTPGSAIVIGSQYMEQNFGYKWSHTWRNFGFIWAYLLFFLAVNLISYEYQRDESAGGGILLFRRGKAPKELVAAIEDPARKGDEEQANPSVDATVNEAEKEKAAGTLERATDVFTWRKVCYDVNVKGGQRRLLRDVAGYVAPGKMTALMGESGAGKTTLLNVLAQRVSTGVVTGDMLVNGRPLPVSFQRQTGYAMQQDVHDPTTTVREALQFSALLRQPRTVSKAEKFAYVEEIIKLLEMEPYAEALVGEVGMGLNVEQRKRLTIGVELAAKPALLIFLDEPTSGLDANASWSIILLLRKLAEHGQAILATIHQPSSELFQAFDRLLLLKKGGQTVYFGDIGKNSETLLEYFHARADKRCKPEDNPAEYILDVIGAGAAAKVSQDWGQLWLDSDLAKKVDREIDELHRSKEGEASQADESPDAGRDFAAPVGVQFATVLRRNFANYNRDSVYVMSKVGLNVIAGLFIGFSFYRSPHDQSGLQNFLFAVFMAIVLSAPLSQQLQPKFLALTQLYEARERASKMYSWPVFVITAILVEIPFNIVAGTIFFLCWYWTVGFPSATNRAGYAYLLFVIFETYFPTFAIAVASFSPTPMAASVLFSSLFSFVIIFNGVVQPPSQLPSFWNFMYHTTPFTYLVEGLLTNAIGGAALHCTQQQFQRIVPPAGQQCVEWLQPYMSMAGGYAQVLQDGSCGICAYSSGDQYLRQLNMSYSHRWRDVGLLFPYIGFNIFATFVGFYLFRIFDWSSLSFRGKKSAASPGQPSRESAPQNEQEKAATYATTAAADGLAADGCPEDRLKQIRSASLVLHVDIESVAQLDSFVGSSSQHDRIVLREELEAPGAVYRTRIRSSLERSQPVDGPSQPSSRVGVALAHAQLVASSFFHPGASVTLDRAHQGTAELYDDRHERELE
ncbi:Brefeldin A resistance protein [Rhodotorula toruloides]|nr:Brefeldin A resistance protein [Rhodotorula toruloides]